MPAFHVILRLQTIMFALGLRLTSKSLYITLPRRTPKQHYEYDFCLWPPHFLLVHKYHDVPSGQVHVRTLARTWLGL